jgi:prepilin-type N-terminal cleavage/methylation domain-containing protein
MRRHRAFTIIELLVVIGIIAVLLAILLPVLWRVRGAAMNVVCSARLRDLGMAASMYRHDHKAYPGPMQTVVPDAAGGVRIGPSPQLISGDLLNQLRPYLNFPEVQLATPTAGLPPFVQCPFVEADDDNRGPFAAASVTASSYYTGYAYIGRITEVPPPPPPAVLALPLLGGLLPVLDTGTLLKPGRAAEAREARRAVLWSDNLYQTGAREWQYSHTRNGSRSAGGVRFGSVSNLLGQHRAFTDGSVEWAQSGGPDLRIDETPQNLDLTASFKTSLGERWWF